MQSSATPLERSDTAHRVFVTRKVWEHLLQTNLLE